MAILITAVITTIISWASGLILQGLSTIMESFGKDFAKNFGNSLDIFTAAFGESFIESATSFFVALSCFLIIVFSVIGIIRNVTSGLGFVGEDPVMMAVRIAGAVLATYAIQPVFGWIYTNIFGSENGIFVQVAKLSESNNTGIWNSFYSSFSLNVFYSLIFLFFTIMIFKSIIELIVEMVERYLLVGMLILISPLVACALTLKTTMKVFTTYCRMFFSHLLLLIMSSLTITMLVSCINFALDETTTNQVLRYTGFLQSIMPLIIIYAFTRIASRIDNYMRDIGLNVGVTGGDMFTDIYSAFKLSTAPGHAISDAVGAKKDFSQVKKFFGGRSGSTATTTTGPTTSGASFNQKAANAASRASNGALDGNSKVADMRKDENGNSWMKTIDKDGNTHLLGLSSEPLKDESGNLLRDKNGNPLSKAFQGENGQSYYLTDYSAGVLDAQANNDADGVASAQKLLNPAMKDFNQMEKVADIGTTPNSNSITGATDINSDNGLNFASAIDNAEINGVNANEFSAMTESGVDMTPENYNSAVALQNISGGNGDNTFALTGEDGRASSSDISMANALTSNGIEVTPESMSVAQSVGDEITKLGATPSQENISSVIAGQEYQLGPTDSMAIGSAIVASGETVNKENFASYMPMAKDFSSNNIDITPENLSIATMGNEYGFTPSESVSYAQLGSNGPSNIAIDPKTALAFADYSGAFGLSKEDSILLAKSIQQSGEKPNVHNIDTKTINYFNQNKDDSGMVPQDKMRSFFIRKGNNGRGRKNKK